MSRKYESTAVMLRPDQLERLRALSEETKTPMSVMHREAIDEWLQSAGKQERMADLIEAARQAPCLCAVEYMRQHDGMCTSCWALEASSAALEMRLADPLPHARRPELQVLLEEVLERQRSEQRARAERRGSEGGRT